MNGLAQAADFTTAEKILSLLEPKFSSLIQLLLAYKDNGEVMTCILKFYASVAQFVTPPDITVDYYGQFTKLFCSFGGILHGGGINDEELTEYLFTIFNILEGLVSNTMMSNDIPPSADAVFNGMLHIVLPQTTPGRCLDLKFCVEFMKLVSLIITFFPCNRFAEFSPNLLEGLMKGLEYGIEHASFEIAQSSFESLAALGYSCWRESSVNGIGEYN
jgi:hypothetical protein